MVSAVIPVRAGSRRLKNKNLAPFAGKSLLEYKIEQLKKVKKIDRIYVSSDSEEMLRLAQYLGVFTHRRSQEYCDEITKTFGEVVNHICSSIEGEIVIWATCTSPLVDPELYSQALELYQKNVNEGYDSLITVEEIKRYIWDYNGPINYELGLGHVPSQNLTPLYFVTDGILIAPRLKMIEWNYFHGFNPFKFIIPKFNSIDIDDELDLVVARSWLSLRESDKSDDYFK